MGFRREDKLGYEEDDQLQDRLKLEGRCISFYILGHEERLEGLFEERTSVL